MQGGFPLFELRDFDFSILLPLFTLGLRSLYGGEGPFSGVGGSDLEVLPRLSWPRPPRPPRRLLRSGLDVESGVSVPSRKRLLLDREERLNGEVTEDPASDEPCPLTPTDPPGSSWEPDAALPVLRPRPLLLPEPSLPFPPRW